MTKQIIMGALAALGMSMGSSAAMAADGNFGCDLTGERLGAWAAKGFRVPAAAKSAFKLWKSVTGAGLAAQTAAKCASLPGIGNYVKAAKAGGITRADIVVAQKDVKLYRAFSHDKFPCSENSPAGKIGGWWSLAGFPDSKSDYREANGVCHSWNNFTHKVVCTLKKGSVVAVGPTQSAACKPGPNDCATKPKWPALFPANPNHQLYLNTYKRSDADLGKFLTGCTVSEWADE